MSDFSRVFDWADLVWRRGLTPEPQIQVSEWAEQCRILPATSAEPGRWRNSRTPYLAEIMDCLSVSSPIERVIFPKKLTNRGDRGGAQLLRLCHSERASGAAIRQSDR